MKISPEHFLDKSYVKQGESLEVITFIDEFTFQHCFPKKRQGSTSHRYRILDDGMELIWGKGAVATCRWNGAGDSCSAFSEMCLGKLHSWEMGDYFECDDTGSTGSDD